jgi:hypothetical protein
MSLDGSVPNPGRPVLEALLDVLAPQDALIVVDNCEHLIGGCAGLPSVPGVMTPRNRRLTPALELSPGMRGRVTLEFAARLLRWVVSGSRTDGLRRWPRGADQVGSSVGSLPLRRPPGRGH